MLLSLALEDEGFYSHLISMTTFIVMLALSLESSPLAPYYSVDLFLKGSLVASHLPFPAGRKVAGIGLWEW